MTPVTSPRAAGRSGCRHIAAAGALLLCLSACAQLPLDRLERELQDGVRPRLAAEVRWRRDVQSEQTARARVTQLAADGVAVDEAVQIALMANPDLQIQLEQLGLARAAWLEANQIPNPVLGWSHRGLRGGAGANVEYSVAQDLLAVLSLPGRRRGASAALQAARFDAVHAVLVLAAGVRRQYLEAVAAASLADLAGKRDSIGQLMYELAERYHTAGNISLMEREQQRDKAVMARTDAARASADAIQQREALLRLLGITGIHDDVVLSDPLPALPPDDPALASLETGALRQRVDVLAARKQAEAQLLQLRLARGWRWLASLEVGASTERDPDGARVTGPGASIQLPLFNAQQAALASGDAQARMALRRAESLALDVRTQLRSAHAQLLAERRIAQAWQDDALPAREAIAEGAQREYFFMLRGPWDPLLAQQELIAARMGATESLRDYWLARTALAAAAGDLGILAGAGDAEKKQ